jgi:hypothetical protein
VDNWHSNGQANERKGILNVLLLDVSSMLFQNTLCVRTTQRAYNVAQKSVGIAHMVACYLHRLIAVCGIFLILALIFASTKQAPARSAQGYKYQSLPPVPVSEYKVWTDQGREEDGQPQPPPRAGRSSLPRL